MKVGFFNQIFIEDFNFFLHFHLLFHQFLPSPKLLPFSVILAHFPRLFQINFLIFSHFIYSYRDSLLFRYFCSELQCLTVMILTRFFISSPSINPVRSSLAAWWVQSVAFPPTIFFAFTPFPHSFWIWRLEGAGTLHLSISRLRSPH